MIRLDTAHTPQLLEGTVRRVDAASREMEVHAARFDVPPGCPILLRGERVKLRLIQPRDRVRVRYAEVQDRRVAEAIEVLPGGPGD
jgi:hypothetical protein